MQDRARQDTSSNLEATPPISEERAADYAETLRRAVRTVAESERLLAKSRQLEEALERSRLGRLATGQTEPHVDLEDPRHADVDSEIQHALRAYMRVVRENGVRPEAMLVELKRSLDAALRDLDPPHFNDRLCALIIGWAIEAYYRTDPPGDRASG